MIDRSAAFKEEFKALMDKYSVHMDYIEYRSKINFYTDLGRGNAVVLRLDLDSETYDEVSACIE